ETAENDALIARKRGEQLAADQITTKDKEKIDSDPAEAVPWAGQFKSEKRGVVNNDHDDRKRAEKIEPRLAVAILKARIDCRLSHGIPGALISKLYLTCSRSLDRYLAAVPAMSRFPTAPFATVSLRPNAHQSYFGDWAEIFQLFAPERKKLGR